MGSDEGIMPIIVTVGDWALIPNIRHNLKEGKVMVDIADSAKEYKNHYD